MKILSPLVYISTILLLNTASHAKPITNIQVILRGQKYDIDTANTVSELQKKVSEQSGISSTKQGRVLFGGTKLDSSDVLEDVGVEDNSVIHIVPSKKGSSSSSSSSTSGGKSKVTSTSSSSSSNNEKSMLESLLKNSGIDTTQLDELLQSLPGGGDGNSEGMPSLQESMEMMQSMMNSPLFQQYMNDPEKLEQSRQMILSNPMMKSMMSSMVPGMDEILNDPIKWRETMVAAANMYKDMGSNMMNLLNGSGAGGFGGMGGGSGAGAFGLDGLDAAAFGLDDIQGGSEGTTTALDELSEGDE